MSAHTATAVVETTSSLDGFVADAEEFLGKFPIRQRPGVPVLARVAEIGR